MLQTATIGESAWIKEDWTPNSVLLSSGLCYLTVQHGQRVDIVDVASSPEYCVVRLNCSGQEGLVPNSILRSTLKSSTPSLKLTMDSDGK